MATLSRHLRRITTGAAWIPEIDSLRFAAILSVVLFHLTKEVVFRSQHTILFQHRYQFLLDMLFNGKRGVPLFFVISGYVLGRPFFRYYRQNGPKVSLGRYYWRRVTRLEPPYILSLLIYSIALLVYFHPPLNQLAPHLLASMFYAHGIVYNQMSTINGVTWSLEIEIQFYLLVPAIACLFSISNSVVRRFVLLAVICFAGILQVEIPASSFLWLTIAGWLQYFLAGFLLFDLLAVSSSVIRKYWIWDLLSIVLWPTIFLLHGDWLPTHALLPILIVILYLAAFLGPISNRLFRIQPIAIIGGMCYSIYLMHQLVISTCFKFTRRHIVLQDFLANYLAQTVVLGFLILIVSTAFYLLVERPCMDPQWPQKLVARFRSSHHSHVSG